MSENDVPKLSKKKEKKAKRINQKINVPESVDAMVQHTNDDSVVSKRSAVTHNYFEDPFIRCFVKKPARRSPLINRGYYLRMLVITDLITRSIDFCSNLLKKNTGNDAQKKIQVISLGAGYDTFAFRSLLLDTPQKENFTRNVQFYDVDFPPVMQSKAALMLASPKGTFPGDWNIQPLSKECPVRSPNYKAVGVDLREATSTLVPALSSVCLEFSPSNFTIIYAECVMQYMPPEAAAELIKTLATSFPNSIFFAYDQINPKDSFGAAMQSSLLQKQSPLLSILSAPDGVSLIRRARENGMSFAAFADFYKLSKFYIKGEERKRVERLEVFDELEEWSEMCEHYGITFGTPSEELSSFVEISEECFTADLESDEGCEITTGTSLASRDVETRTWPSGRFGFQGWGCGSVVKETLESGDVLLVSFGGFEVGHKGHQRVNSVRVHSLREGELHTSQQAGSVELPPLVFHTFEKVAPFVYIVFGGRAGPDAVSEQVFLVKLSLHPNSIPSLGVPVSYSCSALNLVVPAGCDKDSAVATLRRFRHCFVVLDSERALVIGGKNCFNTHCDYNVLLLHFNLEKGEFSVNQLSVDGLPSLYSAAACGVDSRTIYLSGGLNENLEAVGSLWRLDLDSRQCNMIVASPLLARFSHTMSKLDSEPVLLFLGGNTSGPKRKGGVEAVTYNIEEKKICRLALPEDSPCWSKHATVELQKDVIAVLGGGYTCFSFGTFSAKPLIVFLSPTGRQNLKMLLSGQNERRAYDPVGLKKSDHVQGLIEFLQRPKTSVREEEFSPCTFSRVTTEASQPVVFRAVEFGSCVQKWKDPEYLKSTEGETVVSVHVAEESHLLDFVRKNFTFKHVKVSELMDHLVESSRAYKQNKETPKESWYYRSVSTHMKTEKSNIWNDFTKLGRDFELPSGAKEVVMPRLHQSCLRINSPPLQLWTHYDSMDNVLCQIVGRKRVLLFPPSEYGNLYMSGSSSPVINLDDFDILQYPRVIDALKKAVEVILEPGDMLYFPANWYHHITTIEEDSTSYVVSVNVFFRHFDPIEYDKKDLYGNKDPQAVVHLRDSVVNTSARLIAEATMANSGDPLPPEYKQFAVSMALSDLEKMETK